MFERFTERARDAIDLPRDEAPTPRRNDIGTEHALLGLLHTEEVGCLDLRRARPVNRRRCVPAGA